MQKEMITLYLQGLTTQNANGGVPRYEALLKQKLKENKNINIATVQTSKFSQKLFNWLLPLVGFLPFFCLKKSAILFSVNYKTPLLVFPSVPRIITVHDLFHITVPKFMPLYRRLLSKIMFPFCLNRADMIITPSNSTKRDIVKAYPKYENKVRIVPLAGDLIDIECSEPIGANFLKLKDYFLFIGTIEPRKNLINLLQAYKALPNRLKNKHKLIIAGKQGWGGIDILSTTKKLDLDKYVCFFDSPSDAEIIFLYKNALCLTFPSFYEGFGLPIIEAQQFSVPVITSSTSSMPEIAGDGAILIEPSSIESISKGLTRIATDSCFRKTLSIKAKENAAKYSWNNTSAKIIDIIVEANIGK